MPSRKRRLSRHDDSSKRTAWTACLACRPDDQEELEVNPGLDHAPSTDDINSYIVKNSALQYMDAQKHVCHLLSTMTGAS